MGPCFNLALLSLPCSDMQLGSVQANLINLREFNTQLKVSLLVLFLFKVLLLTCFKGKGTHIMSDECEVIIDKCCCESEGVKLHLGYIILIM